MQFAQSAFGLAGAVGYDRDLNVYDVVAHERGLSTAIVHVRGCLSACGILQLRPAEVMERIRFKDAPAFDP